MTDPDPDPTIAPRPPALSRVTLAQVMLPEDANPQGNIHGGTLMKMADMAGAAAAMRHTRQRVVTVVMDSMTFEAPVFVGDLVELSGQVTWTGRTSIETEVMISAETIVTGEIRTISRAYLVYVAIDDERRPTTVRPLSLETDEARTRWAEAVARRARRLGNAGRA